MGKIPPEVNRARVKASQEKVDRINIYVPKGTNKRIEDLGLKRAAFCRDVIIQELDRLEKLTKNKH